MSVQMSTAKFFGHPKGLQVLFFTEMWERFSYYGMRAILILYMTTEQAQQGMGLGSKEAGAIYGLYAGSVYLLTLPGGWLADNVFGQRKAIWYGGILIMVGHSLLAFPSEFGLFFPGLGFIAFGTGLLKPNISTIVADLYPEGGAKRDAGFSVFYMGINLGAILGQLFVPLFAEWNWHYGFGLAAIGMFFGLLQYRKSGQKYLGDLGTVPKARVINKENNESKTNPLFAIGIAFFAIIMLVLSHTQGWLDLTTVFGVAAAMAFLIPAITLLYILYIMFAGGLNTTERKKVFIIFILFMGVAMFWSGFEQAGSTLNLFARDFTNRDVFGWFSIPAGSIQNANSIFIVILAPIIGVLWVKLAAKGMNPNTPIKFGIGLIFLALGFLVMVFAAKVAGSNHGDVGMSWLFLTYFLHSIGELTISPVGMSATTKLAPRKYVGQMMGIWFVGASVGNLIAGMYASGYDPKDVNTLPPLFFSIVQIGIGAALVFIVLSGVMRKWMGDVK